MKAMVLNNICNFNENKNPLQLAELPVPEPGAREIRVRVSVCGVCHTEDRSPEKIDCMIDTTPAWKPVLESLTNLNRGGRLVINAIRKEEFDKDNLLNLDYPTHLWLEKEIKSVANVARRDVTEFLQLAADIPIIPEIQEFELQAANQALIELKERKIRGAKVLRID